MDRNTVEKGIKSTKKVNDNNKLAIQMLIAMVSGILIGLVFMAIRESAGADSALWATINMDGTAIMQVVATLFVAGCGGYDVTVFQLVVIMVLALIAYSLILSINRPIEILVTSLNVTGDALTSIAVAKSEGKLDLDVYSK